MKKLLLFLSSFFAISAVAGGVITVQGKLISITETEYVVENSTQVFNIKKSAISKELAAKMDHTEVQVTLTVPFSAIDSVHSKKK